MWRRSKWPSGSENRRTPRRGGSAKTPCASLRVPRCKGGLRRARRRRADVGRRESGKLSDPRPGDGATFFEGVAGPRKEDPALSAKIVFAIARGNFASCVFHDAPDLGAVLEPKRVPDLVHG